MCLVNLRWQESIFDSGNEAKRGRSAFTAITPGIERLHYSRRFKLEHLPFNATKELETAVRKVSKLALRDFRAAHAGMSSMSNLLSEKSLAAR